MDKVVHFEIPVDDTDRAKKFYRIFGWEMQDYPEMNYIGIKTTSVDENHMPTEPGAINGGMMKRTAQVKSPVFAINVDSIDASVKKAVSAGGKLVMPKQEIGEMGYYAYIEDTEGNIVGLWENK